MRSSKTSDLALCALFVALIAMGAFLRVPVPLVPFTLQYLFTALAGLLLGAKKGCAAVCAYILLGLLGFPVFAQGGGIGYIFEPSFGYLIGFALGAYATGKVAGHTARPSFARLLAANLCGLAIVYLAGLAYCYCIRNFYLASPLCYMAWCSPYRATSRCAFSPRSWESACSPALQMERTENHD